MPTGPTPSALHERILAAWRAALAIGHISDSHEDFAAAIDEEAGDGQQLLVSAPVSQWFDGSLAPSFRTMMAIAKVARYDGHKTKHLLFGTSARAYSLTEKDWVRFVDRRVNR